jgi:predicted RNA-binding protein associated with RNAse of E/G family
LARIDTVKFAFRRYKAGLRFFENDLVAELPGLIISQFPLPDDCHSCLSGDRTALRFDFVDDWYSVLAFLDRDNRSTGHYRIRMQSSLREERGLWKGDDLLLRVEILQNWAYEIVGEEEFFTAVDDGWMRVHAAANARQTMRRFCAMLNDGCLPQEVMDAITT